MGRGFAAAVIAATMQFSYCQDESTRTWSDATGAFKVTAKLVEHRDRAVRLEKADGTVISVGVARLSKADQEYLARRSKRINYQEITLGAPQLVTSLPAEVQEMSLDTQVVVDLLSDAVGPLEPDPAVATMPYSPLAVPLAESDPYLRWFAPVLVEPASGVLAISALNVKDGTLRGQRKGSVLRCKYGGRLPDLLLQIDDSIHLVGHHSPSGRTLARVGGSENSADGDIVLLEGITQGAIKVIRRMAPPKQPSSSATVSLSWMRQVDGNRIAFATYDTLYLYDLVANKPIYKRPVKEPALSPGGKYIISVEDDFVRFIETDSGQSLGTIPLELTGSARFVFNSTGSKLAMMSPRQLFVWDLPSANMDVELISADYFEKPLGWVGDGLILTDGGDLFDTQSQMKIWDYYLPIAEGEVAIDGGILAVNDESDIDVLRALPVPHPAAAKLRDKLRRGGSKDFDVQPGDTVRVVVESDQPIDQEPIRDAVVAAVEKAGWLVGERSDVEVAAIIGRGGQESLTFKFGYGSNARSESASITPFTAEVQVRKRGKVIWKSYKSKNVPTIIILKNGESVQDAVSEYEKPNPGFFGYVQIPPAVPGPSMLKMIGKSSLKTGAWVDD